jgi:hypothetical protein
MSMWRRPRSPTTSITRSSLQGAFSLFGGHFQYQRKARGAPCPGRRSRARSTRERPPPSAVAYGKRMLTSTPPSGLFPGHRRRVDPGPKRRVDAGHRQRVDAGHRQQVDPGHRRRVDAGHCVAWARMDDAQTLHGAGGPREEGHGAECALWPRARGRSASAADGAALAQAEEQPETAARRTRPPHVPAQGADQGAKP